jgi:alanine-synthesizing transaminase
MFASRTNWNLAPNRLTEALARQRASGRALIDLTVSNPTECGFELDRDTILKALANPAALTYAPEPQGLMVAREAVAGYYAGRGNRVGVGDIFLTVSTSEAYSWVFRLLCNPGDEILIPAPSYPLFEFLADIQDVKVVRYPLLYDHGWQIDSHALEKAVTERTRGVIVVHPNNPTGHFCKSNEMARLNEICGARRIAVIADEVFLDFSLGGDALPGTFAENSAALTFTLSGLSKISGLPQMKVAWLVASGPTQMRQQAIARLEVIADTYLSLNAPLQHALAALLDERRDFHKAALARVSANLGELDRQLASQKACARLDVEGGWNAVVRVPVMRTDEDLAIALIEMKGVYAHPGHFYDFPRDGYLVVSLITPERQFEEGIGRVLAAF